MIKKIAVAYEDSDTGAIMVKTVAGDYRVFVSLDIVFREMQKFPRIKNDVYSIKSRALSALIRYLKG